MRVFDIVDRAKRLLPAKEPTMFSKIHITDFSISSNTTNLVTVITTAEHELTTGDEVTISNVTVTGILNDEGLFNGLWVITVLDVNTFTYINHDFQVGIEETGDTSNANLNADFLIYGAAIIEESDIDSTPLEYGKVELTIAPTADVNVNKSKHTEGDGIRDSHNNSDQAIWLLDGFIVRARIPVQGKDGVQKEQSGLKSVDLAKNEILTAVYFAFAGFNPDFNNKQSDFAITLEAIVAAGFDKANLFYEYIFEQQTQLNIDDAASDSGKPLNNIFDDVSDLIDSTIEL